MLHVETLESDLVGCRLTSSSARLCYLCLFSAFHLDLSLQLIETEDRELRGWLRETLTLKLRQKEVKGVKVKGNLRCPPGFLSCPGCLHPWHVSRGRVTQTSNI